MMWHQAKPTLPILDDCYFDSTNNVTYTFSTTGCIEFVSSGPEKTTEPSLENLNKHPALKQAWEEYIFIKKLLGV